MRLIACTVFVALAVACSSVHAQGPFRVNRPNAKGLYYQPEGLERFPVTVDVFLDWRDLYYWEGDRGYSEGRFAEPSAVRGSEAVRGEELYASIQGNLEACVEELRAKRGKKVVSTRNQEGRLYETMLMLNEQLKLQQEMLEEADAEIKMKDEEIEYLKSRLEELSY